MSKTSAKAKDTVEASRSKNEIVMELVEELGQGGFSNDTASELVTGLMEKYPGNEAVAKLCEALGIEIVVDRDEKELPLILFSLNNTAYGINSKYVLSIEILGEITPVVDLPAYCPGIVRSRGEMIELVDIRALFGIGEYRSAKGDSSDAVFMMIVTEINNLKRGLIVDEIIAVEHLTRFEDGIADGREGANTSQYVLQIARREKTDNPVLILNTENIVNAV